MIKPSRTKFRRSKRFQPANRWRSPLRLANFMLIFAIIGVLFLVLSGAAALPGMYGSAEKIQVDSINYVRAANGKSSLQHIECLNTIAEDWTKKMASAGALSHNPDKVSQIESKCGSDWSFIAENVGVISISPDVKTASSALFDAFMGSAGHKSNILDSRAGKVGVGAYVHTNNTLYVTQLFAGCSSCGGNWNTNATLPSDPVATAPAATGNSYYMRNSNTAGAANFSFNYGKSTDVSILCDWNGDGKTTAGVFRAGTFYLTDTNSTANYVFAYGNPDDIPTCGDWNGDGKDTVGVYRPSTAKFYMRNANSSGTSDISFAYGNVGDKPIVGDWNGDGIDTVGVYRGSTFYLSNSSTGGNADISFSYGTSTDKPLAGDWNDDGKDTVGVYRPSTAKFYMRNTNSSGISDLSFNYGVVGDKPIVGDWDGNGTTTIGIRR